MTIHNKSIAAVAAHLMASTGPLLTKEAPEPLELLTKKFGEHVAATLEKLGATNEELAGLKEGFARLEQKMARSGGGEFLGHEDTWGEKFTRERGNEIDVIAKERGKTSLQIKATLTSATTNAAGSVGAGIAPSRDAGIMMLPRRRLTIRNLMTVVPISSNMAEYVDQAGRTNGAGMVAEAAAKPESDFQLVLKQVPVRVVAHWIKASRQVLDDIPQLREMIDSELLYGLALKEEGQILNGDNTGQNLNGIIPQATAFAAAIDVGALNEIDLIGLAILQASLTNVPPDGIVIHPTDWWRMRLTKDANGRYVLGDPMSDVQPMLFGLPVVPTEAMAANKFLVGAFKPQTLYDRWEARVEVGFVNDDFTKNLVTILGEERVGLAAKRPEALIYGDFTASL